MIIQHISLFLFLIGIDTLIHQELQSQIYHSTIVKFISKIQEH